MKLVQDAKPRSNEFFVWTTEQVIGLAPDKYHVRTSRGFAVPEKWTQLGRMDDTIWGVFPIKGKPALFSTVNLIELSLNCSCKSRKYPCNHLLSLLLLYAESAESFTDAQIPAKYADQTTAHRTDNKRKSGGKRKPAKETKKRNADILRSEQRRRQNITAGLLELELWLHDMIEHGLAAVQDHPKTYWTTMADRLVDYQVGEIAQRIRTMSLLPGREVDWHETLLKEVGWLYLLIQGFKQYDDLPLDMQMNLRMAVGWMPRFHEAIARGQDTEWQKITDSWIVIGKQSELRGKQTLRRTWLWGAATNRPALLLDVMTTKRRLAPIHIVGSTIDTALHFAPTTTQLYAQIAGLDDSSAAIPPATIQRKQAEHFVAGYNSVNTAATRYRQAITTNPWLRYFPIALNNVTIDAVRNGAIKDRTIKSSAIRSSTNSHTAVGQWGVRDIVATVNVKKSNAGNRVSKDKVAHLLPLPPKFEHQWYLQALSHQQPLSIFGEWNGEEFRPMSIWYDSRLIETRVLEGAT